MNKSFIALSIALAKADFKLRHEGSYLGLVWYILNPLFTFLLLNFIFYSKLGQNIPNYPIYLLLGIIMFNFFQQATYDSTKILYYNRGVIRSVKFPIWTLILSIVIKFFFSHVFEIIVFLIFMIIFKVSFLGVIFYPVILLLFSLFIYGAALSLSAISVYFADLENIWLFASRLLWLVTPIFYSIDKNSQIFFLNLLNPLYYFLLVTRDVVIYTKLPELWSISGMIGWTALSLTTGVVIFNKLKKRFAEMI